MRFAITQLALRSYPLLFLSAFVPSLEAQETVVITDDDRCEECTISLEEVITLGSPSDPVTLSGFPRVVQGANGNFFAMGSGGNPHDLLIYAPDGSFKQVLSRSGQGPGEFQYLRYLALGAHDSLWIFEQRGRAHVFAPDGTFARTFHVTTSGRMAVPLESGDVILSGGIGTPDRVGFPLHRMASDGNLLNSFGAMDTRLVLRSDRTQSRVIARASERTVWSGRKDQYRIEEWDSSGHPTRILIRETPWFPTSADRAPPRPHIERPEPVLIGLQTDSDGTLWTLTAVADEHWRAIFDGRKPAPAPTNDAINRMWDMIIEAIDPDSGRVLSSIKIPEYVHGFAGERLIITQREDELGFQYPSLSRVQVQANPTKER